MNDRPLWDEIWMDLANRLAERSVDEKTKVGAVIVTDDNTQVLAIGYNGDHKGGPNQRESEIDGESGFIHAEINALIKFDYNNPKTKIMYVTISPCVICAKAIINAGISRVIYKKKFRDTAGLDLLTNEGVSVHKFSS